MDRAAAYKFLQELVARNPDDAVNTLQDIIVDYLLFPNGEGDNGPPGIFTEMELEVAKLMGNGQKIHAIKLVREQTGLGLAESKEYVENRIWPGVNGTKSEKAKELQIRYVQGVLDKISKDYNMKGE